MTASALDTFETNFALRTIPRSRPGNAEVLLRVAASGVNPLDTKIRAGAAAHAQVRTPVMLGIDLAGTVVEVGAGVMSRFAIGDEVYGLTGTIGQNPRSLAEYSPAEYVAVDADLLACKPARLSMVEAATLPLVAITAWEALIDRANVRGGHLVLIHGGGSSLGQLAIQLAKARGATVYATDTGAGLAQIAALDAEPIDAATVTPESYLESATGGLGFDVVLDTLGGTTLDACFHCVRAQTGHVVSILGWGNHSLAPLSFRGGTYSSVCTLLPLLTGQGRRHHGEILECVAQLVDDGILTPATD